MPKKKYTCFVITPIGDEHGDEYKREIYNEFTAVYDYLILRSLRLAGFDAEDIVRSDRETGAGRISESIMTHLANDDVCIVDLTGLNPNVMYEYGVRVGIGKPVIPIAKAGTILPFDVKDERTIYYSIEEVEDLVRCQTRLEKHVKALVTEGFAPKSGTGSYTDLSERLQRIERELAQLVARSGGSGSGPRPNGETDRVVRELGSAIAAFNYALRNRDVKLGEGLMPRLKAEISKERYVDQVIAQLTAMGSSTAASELRDNWEYIMQSLTLRQQYEEIGCYVSYCNRSDSEERELPFLTEELDALENRVHASSISEEEKTDLLSGIYNQTNRLYYGAYQTAKREDKGRERMGWLFKAIESLRKAIELNPNEASYYYNLAICCKESGQYDEAVKAIDKCLELDTDDSDHLTLAYKVYIEAGKGEEAKLVKEKLESFNPYAAAML